MDNIYNNSGDTEFNEDFGYIFLCGICLLFCLQFNGIKNCRKNTQDLNKINFEELLNKECCICLEDFNNNEKIIALNCGHNFHKKCIKKWLVRKNSCPLCQN